MAPIGMVIAMCTVPGQSVGVAAFNQSLRADLQLSASELAGAYALGTILASLLLPLAGAAIDRFGLRRTILFVAPAFCGACCFISTASGIVSLFVAFLILRLFGQGILTLCSQNTLAMWFDRRLGRVAGITSTFVTLFMAASPLLLRSAIERHGWRTTYQGLGFLVVMILLPLLVIYKNRPEDIGQLPDGVISDIPDGDMQESPVIEGLTLPQAMRQMSYWILIGLNIVWSMVGTSLIFDVQSLGQTMLGADVVSSRWGSIPTDAANTCFFVSVGLMNFVGGFLADKYSLTRLLRIAIFGMLCGLSVLLFGSGVAFFGAYCIYGLAQGLLGAVSRTIWPRFFGRAHLGKIRGGSMMAMVAGSSLGPLVMGFAVDQTGSFQIPLAVFAVLTVIGFCAAWFIRSPRRA